MSRRTRARVTRTKPANRKTVRKSLLSEAQHDPSTPQEHLLYLQKTIGNQGVSKLILSKRQGSVGLKAVPERQAPIDKTFSQIKVPVAAGISNKRTVVSKTYILIKTGGVAPPKSSTGPTQTAEAAITSTPPPRREHGSPAPVDEATAIATTEEMTATATGPIEKAPSTPQEDPQHQAVVRQLKIKAKTQKTPPKKPETKQAETKESANLTQDEINRQDAYGKHLEKLQQAQPRELTVDQFMELYKTTAAGLAEKLPKDKDSQESVVAVVEMETGKEAAKRDVTEKTESQSAPLRDEAAKKASDYQDNEKREEKPYELKVDPSGAVPAINSAGMAAPKPKTDTEISLDDKSRSLDDALLNHNAGGQKINIDENSLAYPISGENSFDEAAETKRKAQDEIQKSKPRYREQEKAIIGNSQTDIRSIVNTGLLKQHTSRSNNFNEILGVQKTHRDSIEEKKRSVLTEFEGIYASTTNKVKEELKKLEGIEETLDGIISDAEKYFNKWVKNDLEYIYTPGFFDYSDWKGKHESEIKQEYEKLRRTEGGRNYSFGPDPVYFKALRNVQDKSAEHLFATAKSVFISDVNRGIEEKIAKKVVAALNAAKRHIQEGKDKVNKAFATLSPKEQEEIGNVRDAVIGKFATLEESVDDRQREIISDMARTYNQSAGKLKAKFDEIKKDVLTSWFEKAWNKIKAVVNAIIDFATRIVQLLGRLASLVGDIIASPRQFFSNLVRGIGQGISTFVDRIDEFLATAFFDWLRGSTGMAIQIPKDWNPKGIFSLFTQLLNLGVETIWKRMEVIYGKVVAGAFRRGEVILDKGLEIFGTIKNEGLGGLWEHIKESLGNILEDTLNMIKENVLYAAIKKVILEIGKMLIPGGGFLAIAEKVIRLLQFIAEARNKILDLIESFVDSVEMAVKGNVSGIVKHITGALTKFITIALDFLVNLFGLGGLKEKVSRFIERMRKPVIRGIDWVLNKFKPLVMKGKNWIKGKVKSAKEWGKGKFYGGREEDKQERLAKGMAAGVAAINSVKGDKIPGTIAKAKLAGLRLRYRLPVLEAVATGGRWYVHGEIQRAELPTDKGEAKTQQPEDIYLELIGTGPLESRKQLLAKVREKIGDEKVIKAIFDLREANPKAMKAKSFKKLLQQIVDEDLKGGFKISTELKEVQGKRYLLLHYFGLNRQGGNPVISPVDRGKQRPVGSAWVEDRKLNMDFLIPFSIKDMNIHGAGTKMFNLAEAQFKSEIDAIQATWTKGDIYKNVTLHNMSDNLKKFLDVYNGTNEEEAVKATWTYKKASKEGYDKISDIKIIKDDEHPDEIFAVKVKLDRTTPKAG